MQDCRRRRSGGLAACCLALWASLAPPCHAQLLVWTTAPAYAYAAAAEPAPAPAQVQEQAPQPAPPAPAIIQAQPRAAAPVATFTGPSGAYTVTAPAPVTVEYGEGYVLFRWGAFPGPIPPGPAPPPAPDPSPVIPPTVNKLWVIAVAAKGQAPAFEGSSTIAAALRSLNAEWRLYDPADPKLAAWSGKVPAAPGLLVIEETAADSRATYSGRLPVEESALVTMVRVARGQKP